MKIEDVIIKWGTADFVALFAERGGRWLQAAILADLRQLRPAAITLWAWEKGQEVPLYILSTTHYSPAHHDTFYLEKDSRATDELWRIGSRLARLEVTRIPNGCAPDRYSPANVLLTAKSCMFLFPEQDDDSGLPYVRLVLRGIQDIAPRSEEGGDDAIS